jgi:hypothetical protein
MATPILELDLEPKVEADFAQLLQERGFTSINEFILDTLKADRAAKRQAQLEDVASRMWPDGAPKAGPES